MTEMGPLRVDGKGGVKYNSVGWIDFADVVYLEQPAGVGFSYSNSSDGYNTGDDIAAENNYAFVQKFLLAYPEYKDRPTYLTGESYGGIYVPTLADKILSNSSTQIYKQIAGLMEGNPVFNSVSQDVATALEIESFFFHGLVSFENFDAWRKAGCATNGNSNDCQNVENRIYKEVGEIDQELVVFKGPPRQPSLDPDCLYQDFCVGNGTLDYVQEIPIGCNPAGAQETTYLRRRDVQDAIHVIQGLAPAPWNSCSNAINYNSNGPNMIPLFQTFQQKKPGFKILVYSGDVDIATVPHSLTQAALNTWSNTRTRNWGPWFVNGNTAGYWEQFEHYSYATVKGGGHEAVSFDYF